MLTLLPIFALLILVMILLGKSQQGDIKYMPWQGIFLVSVSIWGAYLILLTESLSLFKWLSRGPIAAGWSLALLAILAMGIRSGHLRRGFQAMLSGFRSLSRFEIVLLSLMAIMSFLLFAVAIATPTNNVDAMDYHMPRVMQWTQNRTLAHFPSVHESQNLRPYWAEAVILHLRVLWGNDQPAGLVQWFIMIASLIATSGIAALLGGGRKAQWLTAVLTFSIPMGLLQATTTQNDYVSAFWAVCLAYFVVLSRKRDLSRLELLGLGLSFGLGMLTKGTFFPFAGPLILWFFLGRLRDKRWKQGVVEGLVLLLLVVATNGLFWGRNIESTGGPYGPFNPLEMLLGLLPARTSVSGMEEFVIENTEGGSGTPGGESHGRLSSPFRSSGPSWRGGGWFIQDPEADPRLVQLARMLAMNFVSPFSAFNQAYFKVLRLLPEYFPEHWVRSLETAAWNHEDSAGSPVHLVLILLSMGIAGYYAIRGQFRYGLIYALILAISFTLVSLIGFSGHIFGIRYQLGFFVLGIPLVGVLFSRWERLWPVMAICMMFYSIPYILISNMRPVIGHTPWPTRVESVFTAKKEDLVFAINPEAQDEYEQIAQKIKAGECKEVGLSFYRNNLEYQLWYLLDAPQSGIVIQHLVSLPGFDRYIDSDFEPCAVVCTVCDSLPDEYKLPISYDYGHVRLFLVGDD
jgi:4-amino-4-deoxy-L-arabinose transferase-like glycosyltransferase